MTTIQYQATRDRLGQLDCVVVSPAGSDLEAVEAAAVFCHGFGAGGDDLVGLAGELLNGQDQPMALVFPAAPIPLDDQGLPGGRAWWLLSIQRLLEAMDNGDYQQIREQVPEGIDQARSQLVETVQTVLERTDLPPSKLLLGGFSQGAMLTVDTACRGLAEPPGGLALFSGALICEREWASRISRISACDILQSHGRMDPILPLQTGHWLRDLLTDNGCSVEFIEFDGPHTIPLDAIAGTSKMMARLG